MTNKISQLSPVRRTPMVAREFIPWLTGTLFISLLLLSAPASAHDGHGEDAGTAFASILHHYEALWQALAADSTDGLPEHAEGIREAADAIGEDFSLEKAGLAAGADVEKSAAFFEEVAKTALYLGTATDLDIAREAFYEISKKLIRLNEHLDGERLHVVYCAMAKKSWLQRSEKIANPYHGKMMSGCGEIVS